MALVGITGADAVFRGSKYGSDFSTDTSDDFMKGEKIAPPDKGGGAGDLQTGLSPSPSSSFAVPSDLQGPNGFLMDAGNQNVVTDVNASKSVSASPKFQGFDAPMKGSGGDDAALNGANDGDGNDDN